MVGFVAVLGRIHCPSETYLEQLLVHCFCTRCVRNLLDKSVNAVSHIL